MRELNPPVVLYYLLPGFIRNCLLDNEFLYYIHIFLRETCPAETALDRGFALLYTFN